ncbi:MAG: hypothetical protein A3J66_03505 [Candidatus Magasanikbacteria bacterium RIFCSPHIGHO2_02_FULL_47_14]|uniref:Uncharacterized protein n=1 Tax=Candidatus Magasanikbacteria bacterium RIFCSPHIGHO2_02_FULL_47_14 TaxID=1798680 RepID=A0A1F6MAU9_9BACT|nr:MAG: hypothetical protein A3J66_03505 [Candidatus Magasanikbacteria bacterium RIFCSPHIGHO2_02_FULL_47_14]
MSVFSSYSRHYRFIDYALFSLLLVGTTVLPLFYLPFTRDVLNVPKLLVLNGFVLAAFLLWFVRALISKEVVFRKTILDIALILCIVASGLATVLSISPRFSVSGSTEEFVLHLTALLPVFAWVWVCIQEVRATDRWRCMLTALISSGAIATLLFLVRDTHLWQTIAQYMQLSAVPFNTVSSLNSVFGVFLVSIIIVSVGLLLPREQRWSWQVAPTVAVIFCLWALASIGFSLVWWLLALGLSGLLIFAFLFLPQVRMSVFSILFVCMIMAWLFALLGSPQFIKKNLPVEVTMGFQPSWSIVKDTLLAGPKTFLVGSGPGTFFYDFSQYRTTSFNTNPLVWRTRFHQPFNTAFAVLAEQGLLGSLGVVLVFLLVVGSGVTIWSSLQKEKIEDVMRSIVDRIGGHKPFLIEVCALFIAWAILTAGLFLTFVDVVGWWLWWWFVALVMIGFSFFSSQIVEKKTIHLRLSSQYSLAMSLGVVLYVVCLIILLAFGIRVYAGEVAFTKASRALQPETTQEFLNDALRYRPAYAPYHLAQAQLYLQQASQESQKENAVASVVAGFLARAVNEAKIATDLSPKDGETWETLATMYINARAFAPEATKWAIDALERAQVIEPTNPLVTLRLGDMYLADGSSDKAEALYKKSIELKQDYVLAYQQLSSLYESQQKMDEAIGVYTALIQTGVADAESAYELGRLLYNRNQPSDTDQAIQLWNQVVATASNHSNALYSLGLAYERKGDKNKAIQYYQRVRELNPDNQDIKEKIQKLLQ